MIHWGSVFIGAGVIILFQVLWIAGLGNIIEAFFETITDIFQGD